MKLLKSFTNERGYALIEVVFLVAVIAVLSSIAIPKINNEIQIAYADYLMKGVYSELRFMQVARRVTSYNAPEVLGITKQGKSFILVSSNENKRYRIRIGDDGELRNYILPPKLYFENDFFMTIRADSILNNGFLKSDQSPSSNHIKLKNLDTNKLYKPVIRYDSVGRIRFRNDDSK